MASAVCKIVRPTLRSVKHTQDSNPGPGYLIGRDIWRADDDELSCSYKPAGTTALGELTETAYRGQNPLIDRDGGGRVVSFDMRKYPVAV